MNKLEEIKKMTEKIKHEEQQEEQKAVKAKKETVFHVACSQMTNVIYAGTVNKKGDKWLKQTDVTQEALAAVRDHFLNVLATQKEDTDTIGYQWKMNDGKVITLQLTMDAEEAKDGEA